jgi:N-acetylglucosaminyldiphosphoundecaprenol N-acetyl-beta-D-mannosaminyltransferase
MDILGIRIDLLNLEDCIRYISRELAAGKRRWIVSANPELIYRAGKDKKLREVINSADLILPDGIGVIWAARLFGAENAVRVTGVDLTLKLLEEAERQSWRIFFLGAKPELRDKRC